MLTAAVLGNYRRVLFQKNIENIKDVGQKGLAESIYKESLYIDAANTRHLFLINWKIYKLL